MKPGYKTLEFWLAFLVTAIGGVTASGAIPETGAIAQALGLGVGALATAGYASLRAWKKGADGKPAYKTTEFWLTCASVSLSAIMAAGLFSAGLGAQIVGFLATILGGLGYSVSRGKWGKTPPAPPGA